MSERFKALYWYRRLRRAYRKYEVLPYSRRETWREARFVVRMKRRGNKSQLLPNPMKAWGADYTEQTFEP